MTQENKTEHIKISMLQVNIYRINKKWNLPAFYRVLHKEINFRGKLPDRPSVYK